MKKPKDSLFTRAIKGFSNIKKVREVLNPEFAQAMGVGIDPDDANYRRLSEHKRDLSPMKLERAINISYYLMEVNPLFQRLINMPIEAIQSAGFSIKTDNDKIKELWTDWFDKPSVGYKHQLYEDWREIKLSGEGNWPVEILPNGFVNMAVLSPLSVEAIRLVPGNARVSDIIKQKQRADQPAKEWLIIRNRGGILDGEIFHFPIHKPIGGTRGRPHLFALFDILDLYDNSIFNEAERWLLLKSYLWDMEFSDMKEEEIAQKLKSMFPTGEMKAGMIFGHNDKIKLEAKTPDLKAADGTGAANLVRRQTVGGAGFPDWAFGFGGDVNVATAKEMKDPFVWMIEGEQKEILKILTTMFAFQLQSFQSKGKRTTLGVFNDSEMMDWEIIANNVYPRAFVEKSDAFQNITTAISVAKSQKIIGVKTAREQYVQASNEIGFELSLQEVEEDMEDEGLSSLEVGGNGVVNRQQLAEKVKESKHVKGNGK